MIRGIYTGASGMIAETTRTDVISNNLANANTAGFKKDVVVMKDFANMLLSRVNDGADAPVIGGLGLGTTVDEVSPNLATGPIRTTGNDFDIAIDGRAFFAIQTPQGIRYTRNGTFAKNAKGELVTEDGNRVLGKNGPIIIQGVKMVIGSDGEVVVDGQSIDKLQLVEFANEKQLTKEGSSLFVAPANRKGKEGTSSVRQGSLEMSNVNVISEMVNLISNYRAYEMNSKVVQSQDHLLDKAVNDVGKV